MAGPRSAHRQALLTCTSRAGARVAARIHPASASRRGAEFEHKRLDQARHDPVLHRGGRLVDQLDQGDHAVQPDPLPRLPDPVIFEPVEETKLGPFKLQGLFLRRQSEVAEVYASIIAGHVVTMENIGDFLLDGPRSDRTEQMLYEATLPAIDRAAGPLRGVARVCGGHARIRHHHRCVRARVTRTHDDAVPGRRLRPPPEREHPQAVRRAHEGASLARFRRDAALCDQGR